MIKLKTHLLLVEDNSADACLMAELLKDENCEVNMKWVANGEEAIEYVLGLDKHQNAQRPDVILLDLGLPRISGYDVLKELKASEIAAQIPIIIFSTSRNKADEYECQELGAAYFLSKPHNLKGYESTVQQLLTEIFPTLISNDN